MDESGRSDRVEPTGPPERLADVLLMAPHVGQAHPHDVLGRGRRAEQAGDHGIIVEGAQGRQTPGQHRLEPSSTSSAVRPRRASTPCSMKAPTGERSQG